MFSVGLLMRKLTPKIVLAGWCLLVLYRLVVYVMGSVWPSYASSPFWVFRAGAVLVPGIGGWLAWRLYVRPRRSVAVWFVVFCLLLFWKLCLSEIVFRMHPAMGGYRFGGAVAAWWDLVTSNLVRATTTMLSLALVLFSLVYWPRYCMRGKARNEALNSESDLKTGRVT
jgi:hypothetical protein